MRVLVCGDRDWTDAEAIERELIRVKPSVVIEGECRGADLLARAAAERLGIAIESYPANWQAHGRAAGPIRNRQMLEIGKPDLVLAFHPYLPSSKGTKDMVRRAQAAGIPVRIIAR